MVDASMRGCAIAWFPGLVGAMILISVFVTYGVAVHLGHVDQFLPYISDSGDTYFERNLFSSLMSITAFLGVPTLYFRYLLILKQSSKLDGWASFKIFALIGCIIGEIVLFSFFLVGNFQSNSPDYIHQIAAAILIGCGTIYCIVDTIITGKINKQFGGKHILVACRASISAGTLIFSITFFAGKFLSEATRRNTWDANVDGPIQQDFWNPKQPGYELHLLATISEWTFVTLLVLYFFTFAYEFKEDSLDLVFGSRRRYRKPTEEKMEDGNSEKNQNDDKI